jgi:peptidyl-prolyl cis-trans isomerase C
MKQAIISALIVAVALSVIGCNSSKGGKVLVTVGGEKITQGYLDSLSNINPRIKSQMASEFGKKKILDNLVEQELLYKASVKDGLTRDPVVKDKIEIYRKVIISQAYLDKKLKEDAKKYYEDNKGEFEKVKLAHILIKFKNNKNKVKRSEKEALNLANKIKGRIKGGESFEVVAKEVSEDTMTNKRGGDLGRASKGEARLARRGYGPVLEKAFTMKVTEVEGPIKTKDGYHILTVTEEAKVQPFDAAEQGIMFKVRANARNKVLTDLKKKYKVEYAQADEPKKTVGKPPVQGTKEIKKEKIKIKEKAPKKAK